MNRSLGQYNFGDRTRRPNEKYLDPKAPCSFPQLTDEEWYEKYGKPERVPQIYSLYIDPKESGNIKNIIKFFETKCTIGIILNNKMREPRNANMYTRSEYYIIFKLREFIPTEKIFGGSTIPNEYIQYGKLKYIENEVYIEIAKENESDQVYLYEEGKEPVYRPQNQRPAKPRNQYPSYTKNSTTKVLTNGYCRVSAKEENQRGLMVIYG